MFIVVDVDVTMSYHEIVYMTREYFEWDIIHQVQLTWYLKPPA